MNRVKHKRTIKSINDMPNYQNSKIYKLVSNYTDKVYYGSTIQPLHKRKGSHSGKYQYWKNGKCNNITSFELFELGEVDIVLVENYPCNTKEELHARERYYIETFECLNKIVPTRTIKEWREANKDKLAKYYKEYSETNKDKIKQYQKEYYEVNKERLLTHSVQYRETNKDNISARRAQKINCKCGSIVSRRNISTHKKSKKHQEYVNSLF